VTAVSRAKLEIRATQDPSGQAAARASRARLGHLVTSATPARPDQLELLVSPGRQVHRVRLAIRVIPVSRDPRDRLDNLDKPVHRVIPDQQVALELPGPLGPKVNLVSRVSLVSLELLEHQVHRAQLDHLVQPVSPELKVPKDHRVLRVRPDRRVQLGQRVRLETLDRLE
jgi:hypothetical protein